MSPAPETLSPVTVGADTPPAGAEPLQKSPESPSAEQLAAVLTENQALRTRLTELDGLKDVVAKVKSAFFKEEEGEALTKEETLAVEALKRLLPKAFPGLKYLDLTPKIMETLQAATRAGAETIHQGALDTQLILQKEAGFPVDKPEFTRLVGGAITAWINESNDRKVRYWQGDRTVVQDGFKHVQKYMLTNPKDTPKEILKIVEGRPKTTMPSGGGPAGGGETGGGTVTQIQSRKEMKAAFRAALG